eukprot:scaffold11715_cov133-Isochrysis_galbana.AAC.4
MLSRLHLQKQVEAPPAGERGPVPADDQVGGALARLHVGRGSIPAAALGHVAQGEAPEGALQPPHLWVGGAARQLRSVCVRAGPRGRQIGWSRPRRKVDDPRVAPAAGDDH